MLKDVITSYEKMKKQIRGYLLPFNFVQSFYLILQSIQGDRTIDEYMEEFHQLIANLL